jgi:PadR family transcriptional regulator, regulatory protein PadR
MKLENTEAQMRKGILELCVLSITSQRAVYPSDILGYLKKAQLIVVEGTIYPLLNRLKNAKLLDYNWVESESGPPRKYYSTTEEGKLMLQELREHWINLNKSVQSILEYDPISENPQASNSN